MGSGCPADVLRQLGLSAAEIDFCTFDHLHVQDPLMILGSSSVIEGETEPRKPLFGNAKMLVHSRELAALRSLHPMQWAWYVENGLDGVDPDSFVTFDSDMELGPGIALLWTPGHTDRNHSLVLNTPDGVWVSSENGISIDNLQPEQSKIPGVRRYHDLHRRDVCPNANTLEDSLDQYDSMVKEKTLADPCRDDPRWLQILPSTELANWRRFWPVRPTYSHGKINYGTVQPILTASLVADDPGGELGPRGQTELVENVLHVSFSRALRDHQGSGYLFVAHAADDQS